MTAQVRMPGVARLNETGLALLLAVGRMAGRSGRVVVGNRRLMAELSCCAATLRRAKAALRREGLIETVERRQGNGGRLEDEYVLTRRGRDVLDRERSL